MAETPKIFGLMASFASSSSLRKAARRAVDEGFEHVEAFTPYPVEGLAELLGHPKRPIAPIILVAGLAGAAGGFLMMYGSWVWDFPINIGGRPMNSWPAFVPIAFETGVLLATIAAVVTMVWFNRLPRLHHPVFEAPDFDRATTDRFFLLIEARGASFDQDRARQLLESLHPVSVSDVPVSDERQT